MSQAKFAAKANVDPQQLSKWERGVHFPDEGSLLKLGLLAPPPLCWEFFAAAGLTQAAIDDKRDRLLGEKTPAKGRKKTTTIPLPLYSDEIAAGMPREIDENEIEEYIWVPKRQARPGMFCLWVKGDSMSPILESGYMVAVDPGVADPVRLKGKIICARRAGGSTIKRLRKRGRDWILVPENENPEHTTEALRFPEDRIIGRVAWWYGHQE